MAIKKSNGVVYATVEIPIKDKLAKVAELSDRSISKQTARFIKEGLAQYNEDGTKKGE